MADCQLVVCKHSKGGLVSALCLQTELAVSPDPTWQKEGDVGDGRALTLPMPRFPLST